MAAHNKNIAASGAAVETLLSTIEQTSG